MADGTEYSIIFMPTYISAACCKPTLKFWMSKTGDSVRFSSFMQSWSLVHCDITNSTEHFLRWIVKVKLFSVSLIQNANILGKAFTPEKAQIVKWMGMYSNIPKIKSVFAVLYLSGNTE